MNTQQDLFDHRRAYLYLPDSSLGSGKYSLELIQAAIEKAGAQIVTLALRRANEGGLANILDYIPKTVTLLPNTSGARNADEAVRIAHLARELAAATLSKSK